MRSQLWKDETWGERVKISFGEMMAAKLAADAPDPAVAQEIDKAIEEDYRTNL